MFLSVGLPNSDVLRVERPSRDNVECSSRTVVVVLGMHRSGTSCAAGTLVRLGAAAPRHLMAPKAENERGFWESSVIVELNDVVLAAGGTHWKDWRKFNLNAIDDREADALRARAHAALAEEFGHGGLAVIKDPRMCRLMPFWARVFEEAKWSLRVVLPVRSPLEVAWSLNCRDGLRLASGCLLWLRHVLDAEAETRGLARAVLDWPQFLNDRRKALAQVGAQLGLVWPRWNEGALAEVDQFVSADLRRHRASEVELQTHPAVSDLILQTYAAMIDLVGDPEDTRALRKLDDLRACFETAAAIFDCPMRDLDEEVREIRSRAAAEVASAEAAADLAKTEAMIARSADRCGKSGGDSATAKTRPFWKPAWPLQAPLADEQDLEAIRNSLFFSSSHYLETNPDVRAAGMDAALHYLVHGGREGRDPGPFFSTQAYLARYPDVAEAGLNALLHYETQRRRESRRAAA